MIWISWQSAPPSWEQGRWWYDPYVGKLMAQQSIESGRVKLITVEEIEFGCHGSDIRHGGYTNRTGGEDTQFRVFHNTL